MKDRQKLITDIDGRIKNTQKLLENSYIALGRYAVAQTTLPGGKIRDLAVEIADFRAAIEATTRTGERIHEITGRIEDIRKNLRQLEKKAERCEKEIIPVYGEFGKTAAGWDDASLPPETREAAAAVKNLQKEVQNTDEKVISLKDSAKEKPFFSKVVEGGKVLILNSSKNMKRRSLDKMYQNFGKVLLQSLKDIPPGAYLDVYRENREKIREAAAETEKLKAEKSALEKELQSLGVEKRFQKRLKDLEIQNEKNNARLTELMRMAGQELYENHRDFGSGSQEADNLMSHIEIHIQREKKYAEEKTMLEAALAYDNLTQKIHELRQELEYEENTVIAHRSAVENLKNIIAETEKERKQFEKKSREGEKRQNHGGHTEHTH
jgi:chromosome segregation ATPase